MPSKGVSARAQQQALLSGLAHQHLIDADTRRLLDRAEREAPDEPKAANLRETRRAYDRAVKVPTALVKTIAQASAIAKDAWAKARETSDFARFAPHLTQLIDLKRKVAECVGYEHEPYDALLDEYEPGVRAADLAELFARLRRETVDLLDRVRRSSTKPDTSILRRSYPTDGQARFGRKLAEAVGFDFTAGRCDVSVHPFCSTIGGPGDVRITTRYDEAFLPAALFGTLHEVGHALYEQGLPSEHTFTPLGEAVSLGVHESQSRMWENLVGRSRAFWSFHFAELSETFPSALAGVTLDDFVAAVNAVEPSLIRVEADELTYNLHIIVRFELERAMFCGALAVDDVPAAWNEKMGETVGVVPPTDGRGCLQDIHWSLGAFGYFPTYALGNLYAAQFFAQARADIPDLIERIERNDHRALRDWLRANIHRHGQRYRADELVRRVTGRPLSIEPFMTYIREKVSPLYGL